MTVITLGNLPEFNFLVVDTQTCNNTGDFEKLKHQGNENKIRYNPDDHCIATLSGSGQLLDLICNYVSLGFMRLTRERIYRDSVIFNINSHIKAT